MAQELAVAIIATIHPALDGFIYDRGLASLGSHIIEFISPLLNSEEDAPGVYSWLSWPPGSCHRAPIIFTISTSSFGLSF